MRDGDDYVINGQKTWTTLGQFADWIFVLARTNPDAPKKQAGIWIFLVEMNTPGITLRPIKLIDGGSTRSTRCSSKTSGCPPTSSSARRTRGSSYAKFLLSNERTGVAGIGSAEV